MPRESFGNSKKSFSPSWIASEIIFPIRKIVLAITRNKFYSIRLMTSVSNTAKKINHRWSFAVSYWVGQEIRETFSVGQTKAEALKNWFIQYYEGNVPEKPCLPSKKNTIFVSWIKPFPAE
jgi:hypothetical protein